eukprot:gene55741-74432_t
MRSMYPMKSVKQASPSKSVPLNGGNGGGGEPQSGRRIQVRRSGVHGRGVFARRLLEPGERVIEYTGKVISWEE